ncbi:MAG: DUF5678 domain-containing protein [Acidobacteria bacterium]|nr:DUF5678 domain-containing protein [Acidobacteriota bacterium]
MLDTAVEKVIAEIERLSSEQQKEVLEHLEKKVNGKLSSGAPITPEPSDAARLPIKPRIVATNFPIKDRSKEKAWLAQHRDKYAGQWVALDGDRLLGHGNRFKDVAKAADDAGVPDALIFIVEATDKPNFTPRIIGAAPPPRDRSKEYEWLEQHRKEYSHQWVALDGDRLVSSNTDCRLAIDEARQKGVPDALIAYVEPTDARPLIIW